MEMIRRKSALTGIMHERYLDVDAKAADKWLKRWLANDPTVPHLQDAFPNLPAPEREFIFSGITPDEWALDEVNSNRLENGLPPIQNISEMGEYFSKDQYSVERPVLTAQRRTPRKSCYRWWPWPK